jgi:hypothetical protein
LIRADIVPTADCVKTDEEGWSVVPLPTWAPLHGADAVARDGGPDASGARRWLFCESVPSGALRLVAKKMPGERRAMELAQVLAAVEHQASLRPAAEPPAEPEPVAPAVPKKPKTASHLTGLTSFNLEGGLVTPPGAAEFSKRLLFTGRGTYFDYKGWTTSGVDIGLGFSLDDPGFAYELGLRVGPGRWIGNVIALGAYTGFGFDGVTAREPFALRSPVGVASAVHIGPRVTLLGQAAAWWTYATKRPDGGGPIGFDEYSASLDVNFSKRVADSSGGTGKSGTTVGLGVQELGGAMIWSLRFGTGSAEDAN